MKPCEVNFKASVGDKVRSNLTGFKGSVVMLCLNDDGNNQYYVNNANGKGLWISEKHIAAA